MFYNLSYSKPVSSDFLCFKTDSLGAFFSDTIIDKNPNCEPLPVLPQVYEAGKQISPSSEWYGFSGCITAKGIEQYVTVGNFADNTFSNRATVDSIGYFLFIDDVSVIPEITKQFDTAICNVKEWKLNAQQLRKEYSTIEGGQYQWNDGNKDMERKFTTSGDYTLKVINKNCFTDCI